VPGFVTYLRFVPIQTNTDSEHLLRLSVRQRLLSHMRLPELITDEHVEFQGMLADGLEQVGLCRPEAISTRPSGKLVPRSCK
jgi:hypothetical protein